MEGRGMEEGASRGRPSSTLILDKWYVDNCFMADLTAPKCISKGVGARIMIAKVIIPNPREGPRANSKA